MVYKRVRGWTSGRSLPVLNFVKNSFPPPPREGDIELKLNTLNTTDNNFRACYMKYLEIYRKIKSKERGEVPVPALATSFAHIGKDQNTLKYIANSSQ